MALAKHNRHKQGARGVTRQGRVSQLGNGTVQNATGLSTTRTKTVCYVVCVRNGVIRSVQD